MFRRQGQDVRDRVDIIACDVDEILNVILFKGVERRKAVFSLLAPAVEVPGQEAVKTHDFDFVLVHGCLIHCIPHSDVGACLVDEAHIVGDDVTHGDVGGG